LNLQYSGKVTLGDEVYALTGEAGYTYIISPPGVQSSMYDHLTLLVEEHVILIDGAMTLPRIWTLWSLL
jgi:hypothetical protein